MKKQNKVNIIDSSHIPDPLKELHPSIVDICSFAQSEQEHINYNIYEVLRHISPTDPRWKPSSEDHILPKFSSDEPIPYAIYEISRKFCIKIYYNYTIKMWIDGKYFWVSYNPEIWKPDMTDGAGIIEYMKTVISYSKGKENTNKVNHIIYVAKKIKETF